jgi:hypothetical protein
VTKIAVGASNTEMDGKHLKPMKNLLALTVVAVASYAITAFAGPEISGKKEVVPPPAPPLSFFRANELDLGAFATYGTNFGPQDNHKGIGDHAWGGGLDAAYFPWLYAGFRVQGSVVNLIPGDNVAGIISGSFIPRFPLDTIWPNVHLAPYGIAGVGGLLRGYNGVRTDGSIRSTNRVLGDFGGGLEYRFTPHIGLFGETTYNLVDGPKNNFMQVNWGLRYAF